jgi:uroporphyrinogen decarboxylase
MNSRERVLAAIAHQEPDGVPVDLGATASSGISAIAYARWKEYAGIHNGSVRVYDVVQQLAQPEDEALARLHIDAIDLGRAFNQEDAAWRPFTLPNGLAVKFPAWFQPIEQADGSWRAYAPDGTHIATMPATGTFFDQACFPYQDGYPASYDGLDAAMNKVLWQGLPLSPWDHAAEPGFWAELRRRTLALRESSEQAIMVVVGCNLFEWGTFLRRIDNFLMDLVAEPAEVERLLDALLERHLATLEKVCAAVGDVADIVRFCDDLGTDRGTFMAPATYRRFFKPRQQIMLDYVRRHSTMHTFLHSCGSIYAILPDLIEVGFEIFNPVQISSRNMEPARLKQEFGRDVTFWGGGCDTRHILNRGTPEQVKEHVRRNIETFGPGGGYVFNTVHNILPDVPPENIAAMYAAVDEYR